MPTSVKTSAVYAIKTWHNTLIRFDPAKGQFCHSRNFDLRSLLCVRLAASGEYTFYCDAVLDQSTLPLPLDKAVIFQTVQNMVNIKVGDWLCAEYEGAVLADRKALGWWEHFFLVPLYDISVPVLLATIPKFRTRLQIPKQIHQICITSTTVPTAVRQNSQAFLTLNPGWGHTLWSDRDIYDALYEWYGFDMIKSYTRINPRYRAAQADLFRYCLIYKMGGVYLDLKAGLDRPLDQFIREDDVCLLSHWSAEKRSMGFGQHPELAHMPEGEFLQWFLISDSGHVLLEDAILRTLRHIHEYDRETHGVGKMGVLRTTGPIPYSLALHKRLPLATHRMIDAESDGLIFDTGRGAFLSLDRHYTQINEDVIL